MGLRAAQHLEVRWGLGPGCGQRPEVRVASCGLEAPLGIFGGGMAHHSGAMRAGAMPLDFIKIIYIITKDANTRAMGTTPGKPGQ